MVSNSIKSSWYFLITLDFILHFLTCTKACGNNDGMLTMPHWLPTLDDNCDWFPLDKDVDLSKFNPKEVFHHDEPNTFGDNSCS